MAHSLPPLPWEKNALQPVFSAETLDFHYGKHHATYVNKLNELVAGSSFEKATMMELIAELETVPQEKKKPIYNNLLQHFNHSFYWDGLAPKAGGNPTGEIGKAIDKTFGSFKDFQTKFNGSAVGQFGSGWAWLVRGKDGKLAIETTSNADSPITEKGKVPLLTCDVWEHAYYIDYRNGRAKYVEEFWKLVNWNFVAKNYQK